VSVVANPKGLDDEIKAGLDPAVALAKMVAKKYKCGQCGAMVPYGTHCVNALPVAGRITEPVHVAFAALHGYLYQEIL
jgi:hypothetical protein